MFKIFLKPYEIFTFFLNKKIGLHNRNFWSEAENHLYETVADIN
jgi:hypothetical protein